MFLDSIRIFVLDGCLSHGNLLVGLIRVHYMQCNSPFFLWKHVYTVTSIGMSEIYLHVQFVAGSQPVNALAFVIDGIYYGVSDFGYAAYSMVISYHG